MSPRKPEHLTTWRNPRLRGRWMVISSGPKWTTLRSLDVVRHGGRWMTQRVATESWLGEWERA